MKKLSDTQKSALRWLKTNLVWQLEEKTSRNGRTYESLVSLGLIEKGVCREFYTVEKGYYKRYPGEDTEHEGYRCTNYDCYRYIPTELELEAYNRMQKSIQPEIELIERTREHIRELQKVINLLKHFIEPAQDKITHTINAYADSIS